MDLEVEEVNSKLRQTILDESLANFLEHFDFYRVEPVDEINELIDLGASVDKALGCAIDLMRMDHVEWFLNRGAKVDKGAVKFAVRKASEESLNIQDPWVQDDRGYQGMDAWNAMKNCAQVARKILDLAKREDLIGIDAGKTLADWVEASESPWLATALKDTLKKHGLTEDDLRASQAKPEYIGKHRKPDSRGPKGP